MHFITMDEEGRDLLEAGIEMSHAALRARAKRRDPDEVISRSVNMSKLKTEGLLHQLRAPGAADFHDLSIADKAMVLKLCEVLINAQTEAERGAVWSKFRAYVFRHKPGPEAIRLPGPKGPSVKKNVGGKATPKKTQKRGEPMSG